MFEENSSSSSTSVSGETSRNLRPTHVAGLNEKNCAADTLLARNEESVCPTYKELQESETTSIRSDRLESFSSEAMDVQRAKNLIDSQIQYASLSSVYELPPELAGISVPDKVTFTWENVSAFVPPQRGRFFGLLSCGNERVNLLRECSGIVKPGQCLAVIGASGAGKTSMLNALSGRNRHGNIVYSGKMRINGRLVENREQIAAISAYVQQKDKFIGTLTVREHLLFHARLRMNKNTSEMELLARVEGVIHELGLKKCENNKIGWPGQAEGLSGGELKRLSFASEILNHPPLLFADEPTSGLDAFMAAQIVSMLQDMASKRSRAIICTIHQPSSEIFSLFNTLCILAEGRIAYFGPSSRALSFFANERIPCPSNYNPADHYIHMLSIDPSAEAECRKRIDTVCDAFKASKYEKYVDRKIKQLALDESPTSEHDSSSIVMGFFNARAKEKISKSKLDDLEFKVDKASGQAGCSSNYLQENNAFQHRSPYNATWWCQLRQILKRCFIVTLREPRITQARVLQCFVMSILFGAIFMRQEHSQVRINEVQNIVGILFLMLANLSFGNLFSVLNTFIDDMDIFMREHGAGLYRTDAYFIAKNIADLPTFALLPIMMFVIEFFMVGLRASFSAFFTACCVLTLVTYVAIGFGYALSTILNDFHSAASIGAPITIILLVFGGFFLNPASVPWYFKWLEYLSWFKYSNEVLNINQWSEYSNINCTLPNGQNMTAIGGGLPLHAVDLPAIVNATIMENSKWARIISRWLTRKDIENFLQRIRAAASASSDNPLSKFCPNGNAILAGLSFNASNLYFDIFMLIILALGLRLIAWFALWMRARKC